MAQRMTRKDAIEYINKTPDRYLDRARRVGYVCPLCGNGSGPDGTGIVSKRGMIPPHFTCFRGCFTSRTVFDVLAMKLGYDPDHMRADDYSAVYSHCGLPVEDARQRPVRASEKPDAFKGQNKARRGLSDSGGYNSASDVSKTLYGAYTGLQGHRGGQAEARRDLPGGLPVEDARQQSVRASEKPDAFKGQNKARRGLSDTRGYNSASEVSKTLYGAYTGLQGHYGAYIGQCADRIGETDCHRGISVDTLTRFRVGYDPAFKYPGKANAYPSPRLILPNDAGGFTARDTRPNAQGPKYLNAGSTGLTNAAALTGESPVFVVEGMLDALSLIDVGAAAVGLNSTSKASQFIDACIAAKPAQPVIIALDNDNAGQACADKIANELADAGIPFLKAQPNVFGDYKDANEALQADRAALAAAALRETQAAAAYMDERQNTQRESQKLARDQYARKNNAAEHLQEFIGKLTTNTPAVSTGFSTLDAALDGGLYEGLYVVGAISSLGKTTFVLQVADQIAASGRDVLIFSLEMSRHELMAKSISRLTCLNDDDSGKANAKTTRGITDYKRWELYSGTECDLIDMCISVYRHVAKHIFIIEGAGNVTAETIRAELEEYKRTIGGNPIIIIDYLQIIQPPDNWRGTDKQVIDRAVMELKRLSRDSKTPVIAVSSLNRASYNTSISFEAFKETGGIEYSADVVIGLQLKGVGTNGFDVEAAKRENPRSIELKILKNRNGQTGLTVEYKYRALFNCFEEICNKPYSKPNAGLSIRRV